MKYCFSMLLLLLGSTLFMSRTPVTEAFISSSTTTTTTIAPHASRIVIHHYVGCLAAAAPENKKEIELEIIDKQRQQQQQQQNQTTFQSTSTSTTTVTASTVQQQSASSSSSSSSSFSRGGGADGAEGSGGDGYRFGDLTRRLIGNRVNQITGKTGAESYEFGDLSRWVDGRIKNRINQIIADKTASDMDGNAAEYEFGDLTKWAFRQVGNATSTYTGKDTYQVGDLSKEVLRRVTTGEYSVEDVWLALRILLSAGLGTFTPLASVLPFRLLLNLVNVGLTQEVTGRLLEALAVVLDRRVKQALTGKADYRLGDITKDRLMSAITTFTGKSGYELGDITKTIQTLSQKAQQQQQEKSGAKSKSTMPQINVKEDSLRELDDWDKRLREKRGNE